MGITKLKYSKTAEAIPIHNIMSYLCETGFISLIGGTLQQLSPMACSYLPYNYQHPRVSFYCFLERISDDRRKKEVSTESKQVERSFGAHSCNRFDSWGNRSTCLHLVDDKILNRRYNRFLRKSQKLVYWLLLVVRGSCL